MPYMTQQTQKPRLTFEELHTTLSDRVELEYPHDSDNTPICVWSRSRVGTPEHNIVFRDTSRRLLLFKGYRMALARKGCQSHVEIIADATSYQCLAALSDSVGQPGDARHANMEALSANDKLH